MPNIGYLNWHGEADRRHKAGEKQIKCPECRLYYFPDWPQDVADHEVRHEEKLSNA